MKYKLNIIFFTYEFEDLLAHCVILKNKKKMETANIN